MKYLLAAGLIFLSSCADNRFRHFYRDPIKANVGKSCVDVDKTIKYTAKEYEGDAKAEYYYDIKDGCRGDKLLDKLVKQMPDLNENDLLFIFTGATHINTFNLAFKNQAYYFSEAAYIGPNVNYFLKYVRTKRTNKIDNDCLTIVYGDDHNTNFDFRKYFPKIDELKGVERIVFAAEHVYSYDSGKGLDFLKEYNIYQDNTFLLKYLEKAMKKRIKFELIGIEPDE